MSWRVWRPAIWLAMVGIAVMLLVNPPYIGVLLIGGALGVALRIGRRRGDPRLGRSHGRRPRS
jgi:hypothetical protein